MAIRFRCPYCRQLLGISVAQTGQVVDCPTCGRSIRVPQQNGKAKAVTAKPRIDLEDQDLSAALDELVALGQIDPAPVTRLGQPSNGEPELPEASTHQPPIMQQTRPDPSIPEPTRASVPTPPPEPIPLAPLPPVQLTDVAIESQRPLAPSAETSNRPAAYQPQTVDQPRTNEPPVSYETELDRLAQVTQPAPIDISVFDPPPRRIWFLPAVATLLVGFTAGYFTREYESNKPPSQPHATFKPEFNLDNDQEVIPPSGIAALTGRVTYASGTGEARPDAGARVVVLPLERSSDRNADDTTTEDGTAGNKAIVTPGLRSGDPLADRERLRREVRKSGGDVAVVQSDGQFRVSLSQPGEYEVLVLSHYQPRAAGEIARPVRSFVEQWFDRGTQVLGQVSYAFDRIAYNGKDSASRDYTFDR